jgi:hypothetical protein
MRLLLFNVVLAKTFNHYLPPVIGGELSHFVGHLPPFFSHADRSRCRPDLRRQSRCRSQPEILEYPATFIWTSTWNPVLGRPTASSRFHRRCGRCRRRRITRWCRSVISISRSWIWMRWLAGRMRRTAYPRAGCVERRPLYSMTVDVYYLYSSLDMLQLLLAECWDGVFRWRMLLLVLFFLISHIKLLFGSCQGLASIVGTMITHSPRLSLSHVFLIHPEDIYKEYPTAKKATSVWRSIVI